MTYDELLESFNVDGVVCKDSYYLHIIIITILTHLVKYGS